MKTCQSLCITFSILASAAVADAAGTWKIPKNLVLRADVGRIRYVMIADDFQKGSRLLAREQELGLRDPWTRYIGVTLPPVAVPDKGTAVFAKGKYRNESGISRVNNIWLIHPVTYGGNPALALFVFAAAGHSEGFTDRPKPVKLPQVDCIEKAKHPEDCPEELTELAPTTYSEGDDRALAVELAYDVLEDLMAGRVQEAVGTVRFYARGAYGTKLYDPSDVDMRSAYYIQGSLEREAAALAASPDKQGQAGDASAMKSLVDEYVGGRRSVKVAISRDQAASVKDTIVLDFKFQ